MTKTKRNNVLLVHGSFLLIVTGANTIQSISGLKSGTGIFGFLKSMPMVEVGLMQAYLLMMLIGIVLLMNVRSERSWRYDLLGASAHLIPLSALYIFYGHVEQVMGFKVVVASSLIHIPWILTETTAAIIKYRKENEN